MRKSSILLALFLLAGCATPTSDDAAQTGEGALNTSERNEDVQVLKVYDGPSISLSKGSIYPSVNQEDCKVVGNTWEKVKAHDTAVDGPLSVTLDCTEPVVKILGFPTMRAVTMTGYRSSKQYEQYYGYVGFSNGGGGFWTKTVELVVKQGAIDAASLNGIGFYLNQLSYRYYEAPPAPGPNNGNGYFLFADQIRAQANQYPATTLKNGESARVIKVMLPGEYATGGTSSVQAFYFRPFAEYVAGGDKHQRWDSVASDYFARFDTSFNREGDVLRR